MEFILIISDISDSLKVPIFIRILVKTFFSIIQNKLCETVLTSNRTKIFFQSTIYSLLFALFFSLLSGQGIFTFVLFSLSGILISVVLLIFHNQVSKSSMPLLIIKKKNFFEIGFVISNNNKISKLHELEGLKKFEKVSRGLFNQLYSLILDGYDIRTYTHTSIIKKLIKYIDDANKMNSYGFKVVIIVNGIEMNCRNEFLENIDQIPYRLHALTSEKGIFMPLNEFCRHLKEVRWLKIPKTYEEVLIQYAKLKSEGIINDIIQIEKFYEVRFKVVKKY